MLVSTGYKVLLCMIHSSQLGMCTTLIVISILKIRYFITNTICLISPKMSIISYIVVISNHYPCVCVCVCNMCVCVCVCRCV